MTAVAQGQTISLDVSFSTAGGVLVDPGTPRLEILRPDDSVHADELVPVRLGTGRYRYVFAVPLSAAIGGWTAHWSGIIDSEDAHSYEIFEVVAVGTGGYAATVQGVRNLLPTMHIDENSIPSEAQVADYIWEISTWVAGRLGDMEGIPEDDHRRFEALARNLVHIGAASFTDDAAHPERSSSESSNYGARLWSKFEDGLTTLAAMVDEATGGTGPSGSGSEFHGSASISSPAPIFKRRQKL